MSLWLAEFTVEGGRSGGHTVFDNEAQAVEAAKAWVRAGMTSLPGRKDDVMEITARVAPVEPCDENDDAMYVYDNENGYVKLTGPVRTAVVTLVGEPVFTNRGFAQFAAVPSEYGGDVRVAESSAASAPHVWLWTRTPINLNQPQGAMDEGSLHLTLDNVIALRDQLTWVIENHYQIKPR